MNKPHVLVVEDGKTVAFLLARSLEAVGCRVTVSDDGMEAFEIGKTGEFDLILLDHLLPGLLGTEVLQRWAEAGVTTPVIMISGLTGEDDVVSALNLGAVDYIRKPFSTREVVARVKVQLRGYTPR